MVGPGKCDGRPKCRPPAGQGRAGQGELRKPAWDRRWGVKPDAVEEGEVNAGWFNYQQAGEMEKTPLPSGARAGGSLHLCKPNTQQQPVSWLLGQSAEAEGGLGKGLLTLSKSLLPSCLPQALLAKHAWSSPSKAFAAPKRAADSSVFILSSPCFDIRGLFLISHYSTSPSPGTRRSRRRRSEKGKKKKVLDGSGGQSGARRTRLSCLSVNSSIPPDPFTRSGLTPSAQPLPRSKSPLSQQEASGFQGS